MTPSLSARRRTTSRHLRRQGAPLLAFLLGACAAPRSPAPPDPQADGAIAIVGVSVVPMTPGGGVLRGQTVVVRDGRIAAVGPASRTPVPRGALRVDGRGRHLLPGLVDMHVHLEYGEDPGILALFLAHGVTTVRNMDGRTYILEWRERVARGELPGPTIHTAGPILDGDPPARADNTRVGDAAAAREAVRQQAAEGYDFVKVYGNLGAEPYRAVLDAARQGGLAVAGHIPRAVEVDDALDGGQHAIEHLSDLAGLVEADSSPVRGRFHWSKPFLAMPADSARIEDAARRVARSGVWIVPTLLERERALAPADSVQRWAAAPHAALVPAAWRALWTEQLQRVIRRMDRDDWDTAVRGQATRRQVVRALHRAGARLLVGTDTPNPFVVPGYAVHEELAALVAAGLPAEAALAAATREAARSLGEGDAWGTVEVGRRADLLLVAGNPLDDVRVLRAPVGVVARGRWYPAARLRALLPPASAPTIPAGGSTRL